MKIQSIACAAILALGACAAQTEPVVTPSQPITVSTPPVAETKNIALPSGAVTSADLTPEAVNMQNALNELASHQATMTQMMLILMQTMTQPELISALKASAAQMEAAVNAVPQAGYVQ